MPNLTQLITRQTGMLAWYKLTADMVGTITDESGTTSRDMTAEAPGISKATWTANQLNGYPAMVHNAETSPFNYVGTTSIRDLFVVAKVDDTTDFDDPYRGFITGVDDTNYPVLVGKGTTSRWLTTAEGAPGMGYLLDDVLQADGARLAPFSDFHRIRVSTSGAALALDGVQVGRDREHTDRLFKGKWADLMLFSTQRTADEAKAIALFYDLKFNLWRTNGTLLDFPTPGMTGIKYRHFYAAPLDWDRAVISHEYEDLGRSFNEVTDTPPREWTLEMDCVDSTHALAKSQYDIFDAFWDAVRTSRPFNFTDKYGTTHTDVRIKNYSRSHSAHKSWVNVVAFQLCKYP